MKKRLIALFSLVCILVTGVSAFGVSSSARDIGSYSAGNTYYINGVYVRADDFASSPDECWVYANKLYKKIWGYEFSNKFNDSTNLLRNLNKTDLTLTPTHLRAYVTAAGIGSVLRVCNDKYLYSNDGWGHSQIIVYKDANGFTVLEGGLHTSPYRKETYYTWEGYCNTNWLGGTYKYIKYIKWPGGTVPYHGSGLFNDIAYNAWYYSAVEYVFAKGLMSGTSTAEFSPDKGTTRGMIVTILYSLADKPGYFNENITYCDVSQKDYFYRAVLWAASNGIVSGYGDGSFGANDIVTREQMAVILYKFALYSGLSTAGNKNLEWCNDYWSIDSWALPAMRWAYYEEIMSGTSDTTMSPLGEMTRAQAAVIIKNYCVNVAGY
ncbi:MAG: S-layer homology domain-containing protein [Clostridia bacterium]|nr:S-layer homology domain-containing protein [Clostridia bacterium]